MLTRDQVLEIQARAEAATPKSDLVYCTYERNGGRAVIYEDGSYSPVIDVFNNSDRNFYFHARADVPDLCETVLALMENNR